MKKLYFFLLLLLPGFALAQIINFPDPAFKSMLLNTSPSIAWALDSNLDGMAIDADHDGEITVAEAQQVNQLYVINAGISDLTGIEYFTNLELLSCDLNSLTSLDVSALSSLKHLNCADNDISNLVINNTLEALIADGNQITTLDFSNHLVRFALLSLYGNLLTSLTVTDFATLYVAENLLTSLNISGDYNTLHCQGNLLTTLDLSNSRCMGGNDIHVQDNPLSLLILKNGWDESGAFSLSAYVDEFDSDVYICVDEDELPGIESQEHFPLVAHMIFGSYCTFVPGGDYNTINGTVTLDTNNNGCDSSDPHTSLFKVNINDGVNTGSSFTNALGGYQFFTAAGNFTLTPSVENAAWFNFSPSTATVNFPLNDNSVATQDFCMTANGVHPDVEIVIAPIVQARPGFDAVYKLVFKNEGNQTLSGNAVFFYEEPLLDFVSAAPAPDQVLSGSIGFNYINLLPFESRTIMVTLGVNAPTDTPSVNDGDLLHFTALINPASGDETPADNTFTLTQMAVNSTDPNHKTCLEGDYIDQEMIGHYLHYNISFENVGTADAINVVVKDILDSNKFDLSTLQILDSSHPMRAQLTGNKLEFIFENINLPPSNLDPIAGHGNVLFKIKTLPTLEEGDMVTNTAHIFFDYNHPIVTNEARTTFNTLKRSEFKTDASVVVYPNPAKGLVSVQAKSNIQSIAVFDVQGRLLQTAIENKNTTTLDLSKQSNGIYFLKITTADGIKVEQIIKE